jgi:hypothetical protein
MIRLLGFSRYALGIEDTNGGSGAFQGPGGTCEDDLIAGSATQPDEPALPKRRLVGSMKGQFSAPDDIKTMFAEEIEEMFYGYRAQHKFDDIEAAMAGRLAPKPEAKG